MSNENQAPVQAQENAPAFSVEKLYVKDLSLEVPHAPAIFGTRNARSGYAHHNQPR